MVLGIDIGSTTTKSVAVYPDSSCKTQITKAFDPITSATGALGKILMQNNLEIATVKNIVLPGVGASGFKATCSAFPPQKSKRWKAASVRSTC